MDGEHRDFHQSEREGHRGGRCNQNHRPKVQDPEALRTDSSRKVLEVREVDHQRRKRFKESTILLNLLHRHGPYYHSLGIA